MSTPTLLDRLGRQITAAAVMVRVVAEHGLDADQVSVSHDVFVMVDDSTAFALWVSAIGQTEFFAWRRTDDNRAGTVALYAAGTVSEVAVTVISSIADLPGVTTEHRQFPLTALGSGPAVAA